MKTALLVIDAQMAFVADDEAGAERSCRDAETNIAKLISHFREAGKPIYHIHHHGTDPDDPFLGGSAGAEPQPFALPQADEPVIIKKVASGFIGTNLEVQLKDAGVERVIVTGATANHCAESTARSAGNLGFDVVYTSDAVWAHAATASLL